MASKLFRAVVGVGIAPGTSSAACFGSIAETDPPPGPIVLPPGASTPPAPTTTGAYTAEPPDAARDVGPDAFCDATWPTTKGTKVPTCGPVEECADAGRPPPCYLLVGPSTCRDDGWYQPVTCAGGEWKCRDGFVVASSCKCWETNPSCN